MTPKISLIIPFYNAATFLPRCIECVKKQEYKPFEAIMIDDGSTDDSYLLCRQLTQDDPRFHVLHQSNAGASVARNTGLDHAQGKAICFMDVDDEIDATYISALVQDYSEDTNLVIQGLTQLTNGQPQDRSLPLNKTYRLSDPQEAEAFFSTINIERFGGPYCKLFDAQLLRTHHIRFNPSIRLAEDLDFLLRYLCICQSVSLSSENHYRYMLNSGSASSHLYAFDEEYQGMCALVASWIQLTAQFPIHALSILRDQSIAYYVYRCLFASRTIADLQSIPAAYYPTFAHYWSASTPYLKLVKWLFSHRYFRLTYQLLKLTHN